VPDPGANALAKDTKLRNAVNTLLPGGAVINRLSRADYSPPADDARPFRGFVWGQFTGGGWVFRYHSFIVDGPLPVTLHPAPPLPSAAGMLA
jgi:hypothetical protein